MKLGMNHPMGPLALADLIGLDVCLDILRVLAGRLRRSQVPPLPAAGQDGRRRLSRPQERTGLSTTTPDGRRGLGTCLAQCLPGLRRSQPERPGVLRPLPPEAAGALRRRRARRSEPTRRVAEESFSLRRAPARADLDPRGGGQAHRRDRAPARSARCTSRRRTSSSPDRPRRPCASCSSAGALVGREEWSDLWESKMDYQLLRAREARALHGDQGAHRRAPPRRQAQGLPPAPRRRRVRPLRLRRRARRRAARGGLQARPRQLRARLLPRRDPLQRGRDRARRSPSSSASSRSSPITTRGWSTAASSYHERGDHDRAEELPEARGRRSTRTPSCRTSAWARSTPAQGNLARAVRLPRAARCRSTAVPQALFLLGSCYYEMGKLAPAIQQPRRRRCATTRRSRRRTICSASPTSTATGTRRRSTPSARRSG